jgi:hypothetical protein
MDEKRPYCDTDFCSLGWQPWWFKDSRERATCLTYASWLMGLKTITIGTKLLGSAAVGVETIPFLLSIDNNLTYSFVHTEHHVSSTSRFHAGHFSIILLEHYDHQIHVHSNSCMQLSVI